MRNSEKYYGIMLLFYIITYYLTVKLQNKLYGFMFMFMCFLIINYLEYKNALHSVAACIKFLLVNTLLLSIIISYFISFLGYININSFKGLFAFGISYILMWFFIIFKAENQVAKLATMIIGQGITALSLIVSYIINVAPIQTINNLVGNVEELSKYGYSSKDFLNIMIQTLFYPILIVALITYVIAELRDYRKEKIKRINN